MKCDQPRQQTNNMSLNIQDPIDCYQTVREIRWPKGILSPLQIKTPNLAGIFRVSLPANGMYVRVTENTLMILLEQC